MTAVAPPPLGVPPSGGLNTEASHASLAAGSPAEAGTPNDAPSGDAAEPEENIYEVMKQHITRKKEELDAQQSAWKQGRPGPGHGSGHTPKPHAPPPAPPIDKAQDLADLPGVWIAARNYLATHARLLESVLGNCARIESLNPHSGETVLLIPSHFKGYANDKGRPRLEEALRAVTDLPVKLTVQFTEQAMAAPTDGALGPAALGAAQRIPPEVMEAVKKQPIIRELMKRLDATVTQVEILDGSAAETDETATH